MKRLSFWIIAFSWLLLLNQNAFCDEIYAIDGEPVLLYKIINWWYYCPPEESAELCGSRIQCRSRGDSQVEYDPAKSLLVLRIPGGFADMLSIFKNCTHCFGPSYLKCTWLNPKYFGSGKAAVVTGDTPAVSAFAFEKMDEGHARLLQGIEKQLEFKLEGTVGGLLNGRIALHGTGDFLQSCPDRSGGRDDRFQTSLKITHSGTNEILAEYSVFPDD